MIERFGRVFVLAVAPVLLTWIIAARCPAVQVDRIVAVVNNEIITLYELNGALGPVIAKIEKAYKGSDKDKVVAEARSALLNKMIENILISQEAKRLGVSVKDDEAAAAMLEMLKKRNIPLEKFKEMLASDGSTVDSYISDLKDHLLRIKIVSREFRQKITVTDEEIGEYYTAHRNDYEGKEAVRLKQIFIAAPKGAAAVLRDKAKARAEGALNDLKAGESFEVVGAKVLTPEQMAGVDLGFVERGMMLPAVDVAAFKLKDGELSPVIETSAGYHIIVVIDRRGAGIKSIKSVRNEIEDEIMKHKAEKRFEEWIQELRKKSHIEVRI